MLNLESADDFRISPVTCLSMNDRGVYKTLYYTHLKACMSDIAVTNITSKSRDTQLPGRGGRERECC